MSDLNLSVPLEGELQEDLTTWLLENKINPTEYVAETGTKVSRYETGGYRLHARRFVVDAENRRTLNGGYAGGPWLDMPLFTDPPESIRLVTDCLAVVRFRIASMIRDLA